MAGGYIPQEILDEIASKLDIVAVIGEYMPLKRTGANYQGLCPFHNEKTPSFSVNPSKQFFYCFGCGKGGNVFKFIMEIEGVSFGEAARMLAKKAGVTLPERELTEAEKKAFEQRKRYFQINELAATYYQKILWDTNAGKPFRDYLEKRQISREIAEKFRLGAAPATWDGLYNFLKKRDATDKELEDLFLASKNRDGGSYHDKFRNRLMFPIANEKGGIIAFGGRIIDQQSAPQKYLNSSDTPLFHKSHTLYGLNVAKTAIRNQDRAILVEGYMDVIACHQFGIQNAVAALGTSFTADQGRLLMRNTYQIAVSLDGDAAGQKATLRTLDILQDLGSTATVIVIPDKKDPDEFLKAYGKDAFETLIKNSQEAFLYKLDRYMETENCSTMSGKVNVVRKLLPDLARLRSAVAQEQAIYSMSMALQVSEQAIKDEMRFGKNRGGNESTSAAFSEKKNQDSEQGRKSVAENIEKEAERIVLRTVYEHPDYINIAENYGGVHLFQGTGADLYQIFSQRIREKGKVDSSDIPEQYQGIIAELLMENQSIGDWKKWMQTAVWKLLEEQLDAQYRQLERTLTEMHKNGEKGTQKEVLAKMDQIRKKKSEYETELKG